MPLPPKLYKYQAYADHSVGDLRDSKLFFQAPARFNDPFDCAQPIIKSVLSDEDLTACYERVSRKVKSPEKLKDGDGNFIEKFRAGARTAMQTALNNRIRIQREERGVTCFGESNTDLLMWAHYTNGHRGFCLEFDTRAEFFSKAIQVVYRPDFPQLGAVEIFNNPGGFPDPLVQALIGTKSDCWSYEREWRVPHMKPNKKYGYASDALTGIYLGAAMPEEHVSELREVFRDRPTKLYRMERSQTSFSLSAVALE